MCKCYCLLEAVMELRFKHAAQKGKAATPVTPASRRMR